MKTLLKKSILSFIALGAICLPMICAPEAFAGEGTPGWRKIYDDVMLFVNFGILAFFFIKYAKKPMMKALGGVKGKIAEEFDKVHGKKDEFKSLRDAEALKNKEIEKYTQEIKENILAIGEREKEKIIEEGRLAAEKMIQDAGNYVEYKAEMARKALSDEMIDMAIAIVEEKLTKGVTEADDEKLVEQFVEELRVAPAQLK